MMYKKLDNAQVDPAAVAYVAIMITTSPLFDGYINHQDHYDEPVNDYYRQAAEWAVEYVNALEDLEPVDLQDDDIYAYAGKRLRNG